MNLLHQLLQQAPRLPLHSPFATPAFWPGMSAPSPSGFGHAADSFGTRPFGRDIANTAAQSNNAQPFPWRDQMRRLAAALHDANPADPGRGHLSALDAQQEQRALQQQDEARRRAAFALFAEQASLTPDQRTLLAQDPTMWLRLFGPLLQQTRGRPPFLPDDEEGFA